MPKRDWGQGMACVGRTKICTIVPINHRGPVPGVEVGMSWEYRVQVNESSLQFLFLFLRNDLIPIC